MSSITPIDYPPSMILTEWAIPQPSKLKYTQQFNTHDRTRTGFLTGLQARNILIQSQLPLPILAQIWNLADIDVDGRLTCDEFVLAMHLIDCVKAGDPVPVVLPPDLVPPSYRRKRSISGATAVPNIVPNMAPNVEQIPEEMSANLKQSMIMATFEDKRRENFEKGQAELDRRRQALLELQRREREERERKEREEKLKREQIKLEQERKRQAEMEKQLERQRELEAEKEEQRRKQLEQREAARREMERQRMLEWENIRKQDLTNQKTKSQEEVNRLKSRKKVMVIEMEQVNNKLNELSAHVTDTKKKVVDVKSEIDAMRVQRDQKLRLMSSIKDQIKGLSDRQLYIEQEKINLAAQLISTNSTALSSASDQFALQNKQMNINQLKSRLESYEQEKAQKTADLASNNQQLEELREKLQEMISKTRNLSEVYESKRQEAQERRDIAASQQINEPETVDNSWGPEPSDDVWPENSTNKTNSSSISKFKYRVLYAFNARNADELSIEPGDIVTVDTSACSEPGWLSGELRAHIGWFPEAYVERINGNVEEPNIEPTINISRQHTTLEGIAEAPENGAENDNSAAPMKSSFTSSGESRFQPPISTNKSPEPLSGTFQARAMYPWKAKEDNHLSFSKGDVITIKEQQDMWWFGELGSSSGWFPKSYVKQIDSSGEMTQTDDEYYLSLYPFESQEAGDLAFDSNELIKVIKKEGSWWTGSIADTRHGVFPSNYVRQAAPEEIPKPVLSEPTVPAPKTTAAPPPSLQNQVSAPTPPPSTDGDVNLRRDSESCDSPKLSKKAKLKKPEIVTVIAPYKATGSEQLSLETGQLIQVRKKTSSGWWEGEIQVKGKKRQVGWFPASYVKSLNPSGGSGGSSARSTPDLVRQQKTSDDIELERVIALYAFKAQHDDELSFEPNDIIKVLAKDDTTWWKGLLVSTGAIGLFPSNHVEVIRERQYEEINDDYSNETLETNSANEYECVITDEERNRQNCINEFIATEKAYVRDMEIVIDVFQVPLRQNNCLSDAEVESIFVNWSQLVKCNQKFLKALRNRKRKAKSSQNITYINEISDIFCHYLINMEEEYIKFCSKQLAAAKLIQYKTENDANFNDTAKKCSQDSRANRLPLSSYLLKPMQRITKYPLLIKKILGHTTPETHCDYVKCLEAFQLSQTLCKKVNEACRDEEDTERLVWIQSHVRCDALDQIIIFNSQTNCLGPRRLLHSGSLIKANSGKEIIGFLFNDFLLLTVAMKEIGRISSVFSSDKAMSAFYRIYKEPLLLNDISITELSQFEANLDPCLFQIFIKSQEKYLILKSITVNERSLWIKSIDSASRHSKDVHRSKNQLKNSKKRSDNSKKIGRLFVTVLEGIQLCSKNTVLNAYCQISIADREDSNCQTYESKCVRIVPSSPTGSDRSLSNSKPLPSSSNASNNHNSQNHVQPNHTLLSLFKAKWNDTTQFIVYHNFGDEFLTIKCYDSDPYAPHYLIGSSQLSLSELAEEIRCIQGPLTKGFRLVSANNISANPVVYLKLDLQYFDN